MVEIGKSKREYKKQESDVEHGQKNGWEEI